MAKARKMSKSELAMNIVAGVLMIVGLVAIGVCVFWAFLKFNPMAGPETHVTTYVNSIIDENGNERQFLEVEYWENKDGRGEEVLEISFNAYSGQDCKAVRQLGVQYNRKDGEFLKNMFNYTKDGGASWKSLGQEVVQAGETNLYLKIEDMPIAVIMDGTYETTHRSVSAGKIGATIGTLGLNLFFSSLINGTHNVYTEDYFYETWVETRSYTMEDFYSELASAVLYNNIGYGTNMLSLVDLANYFTLKKAVGPIDEWTSLENYQEYQNEYFSVKVTKHREGMLRASESGFKMFNGDSEFTLIKTDNMLNDYTGISNNSILTYQDFDYRYCKEYGGYVAYLKEEIKNAMKAGRAGNVEIRLDLSNVFFDDAAYPVIGIMYDFANVTSVDLTFSQATVPQFYEFYDKSIGRAYIPSDSQYTVRNLVNDDFVITHFSEVEV